MLLILLGQVKKKKHVSRPRPLHFLAPPLFFLLFFYEQRFYEQKPTGSLVKPIAAVYIYSPKQCNKLVFNQYLMFRFINI